MRNIYFVSREMVKLPKVSLSSLRLDDKGVSLDQTIDGVDGKLFVAKDYIGFIPKAQPIGKTATVKSEK